MRWLSGFHAIEERLKRGAKGPLLVAGSGPRIKRILELAEEFSIPARKAEATELDRLSPEHRGILLDLGEEDARDTNETSVEEFLETLESENALVLALDRITDPHNLGAILRSADQFACDLVILPARRSAHDNETVDKVSAGASGWVKSAIVPNLARAIGLLKAQDFWVYGADAGGLPLESLDFKGRVCIVMGSEGTGLSRIVRDACDEVTGIPSRGKIDSLNVSVATGILLYAVRRVQWGNQ